MGCNSLCRRSVGNRGKIIIYIYTYDTYLYGIVYYGVIKQSFTVTIFCLPLQFGPVQCPLQPLGQVPVTLLQFISFTLTTRAVTVTTVLVWGTNWK